MNWEEKYLDLFLVPCGLLIMFGYHLFLLYRILRCPDNTAIGYENHNKKAWVERFMQQADSKDMSIALSVISSNITASSNLASLSIVLSSLIGAWVGSTDHNIFLSDLVYGDTSNTTIVIKYISLLSCFLLAFASFIHSVRHFVHANFLMTTPNSEVDVKYVTLDVIKGSNYFSLGLRAHYFAITLLLWIFGPVPMFASSVILVIILHNFDSNSCPLHNYQSPNQKNGNGV